MHTSRPAVGSPDRTLNGTAAPAAAAAPPVPPQVEAEQKLTQLVDSLINLLAGEGAPWLVSSCARCFWVLHRGGFCRQVPVHARWRSDRRWP